MCCCSSIRSANPFSATFSSERAVLRRWTRLPSRWATRARASENAKTPSTSLPQPKIHPDANRRSAPRRATESGAAMPTEIISGIALPRQAADHAGRNKGALLHPLRSAKRYRQKSDTERCRCRIPQTSADKRAKTRRIFGCKGSCAAGRDEQPQSGYGAALGQC